MDESSMHEFNPFMDDPLLTVAEAAEYCKQSVTTINQWRRDKKLPCVRIASDARFRRSDLNKLIHAHISWGYMKGIGQ
jgi:excisionase family DNA binding protein